MSSKSPRYQGCQVLSVTPTGRRVWRFNISKNDVALGGEETTAGSAQPKKRAAAADWQALVRPQLNIAWLPAQSVFVRAVSLPTSDPAELPALVEFQLEKISPLPVNQIVWTVLSKAHPDGQQQTALVIVAARSAVEEFLDREVTAGFTANQLDFPLVRQWTGLDPRDDGLWLLFDATTAAPLCLACWYIGGVWRDVTLLHLPPGEAMAPALIAQLGQLAWAGEMDGWLKQLPVTHLAAEVEIANVIVPALHDWSGHPVETMPPTDPAALATESARALRQQPASSLVPSDWAAAQRQKFIDRLWITGLGALGLAYVFVLSVFLITLHVRKFQRDDLRSEVSAMGINYTNTLQLKAQVSILEDQVALRFAALDAWRAVVNALPPELTLTQLDFQRGQTLVVAGTVSPDATPEVTQFNSDLKKSEVNGQALFANVKPAKIETRPGAPTSTWSFEAELRRNNTP
ncbi:MAG TPA: hypothetical protein PLX89_08045 [Verrucomicrobiota bacterium]|nr:hypothetical protein [Verrucomicrobiales bacterium]HRI12940.1 hypothetical protein [Verrucomicrobiota bacterium]